MATTLATLQPTVRRSALSIEEAAYTLGVSQMTIRRAIKLGDLDHRRLGDRVLIPVGALEEWSRLPIRFDEAVVQA